MRLFNFLFPAPKPSTPCVACAFNSTTLKLRAPAATIRRCSGKDYSYSYSYSLRTMRLFNFLFPAPKPIHALRCLRI